jgi:hypothetical protein
MNWAAIVGGIAVVLFILWLVSRYQTYKDMEWATIKYGTDANENTGKCVAEQKKSCDGMLKNVPKYFHSLFSSSDECYKSQDMVPMRCQPKNLAMICDKWSTVSQGFDVGAETKEQCMKDNNWLRNPFPKVAWYCMQKHGSNVKDYTDCYNKMQSKAAAAQH